MGPQELGAMGEAYTAQILKQAGLQVEHGGPADLVADGVAIEVKAARPSAYRADGRRGFQFCLRKAGHTDARKAAAVVLLCWWEPTRDPVAFVIPAEALGDRRKVVIPGRQPWVYGGRWARWYGRWEVLADVIGSEAQ